MIIQSLAKLYDDLVSRGKLPREGWTNVKISYALCIDSEGNLQQITSLLQPKLSANGKKTFLRPTIMELPAPAKRSSNILPDFLWDNSAYMLGFDGKGDPERSCDCFKAAKKFHHKLLDSVKSESAQAILAYFDKWDPEKATEHPAIKDLHEDICKSGGNLVFCIDGSFAQQDDDICEAWQSNYGDDDNDTIMSCIITGKKAPIAILHPSISGVRGAQSTGASLVSYNCDAFCDRDRDGWKGLIAQVGKHTAFAYTSALNYLLADTANVAFIGDMTVVCWADGAEPQYQALAMHVLFDSDSAANMLTDSDGKTLDETDVRAIVKRLAEGLPCSEYELDPNRTFYILGLSPAATRLSVRLFQKDSFGSLMKHVDAYSEQIQIAHAPFEKDDLPIWKILLETVNKNSRDKAPNPIMAGATVRSILTGERYPASLLENAMLRMRAEKDITYGRAAILKAYYLRNENKDCPKEVLTVALNEESKNIPYTLGRLFAVYEEAQQRAIPGIKATIKSRYFNSAIATPAIIFPILSKLYQTHLKKISAASTGSAVYLDKQVTELKSIIGEEYPTRLNLAQQGSFDLGYYQQVQKRYTKKEDNDNGSDSE